MARLCANRFIARRLVIIYLCCIVPSVSSLLARPIRPTASGKIPIMILASFHLDNPGRDILNLKVDDVLVPKRQRELEELTKKLAAFRPNKIAVESPSPFETAPEDGPNRKATRNYVDKYTAYKSGHMENDKNEVYQIAFRLAKYLNHERVYGVNASPPVDFDRAVEFANQNGQGQIFQELLQVGQTAIAKMEKQLASMTISEFMKKINAPEALLENHQFYLRYFVKFGRGGDYPGVDAVAQWYGRNLRIFVNVDRIAQPGDRILVLFGQGHCHILRQLFKDAPGYQLVDAGDYL